MNSTTERETPETRLWSGVSCGKIKVMQGLHPKHLSTSHSKTEADLNHEYNTSGASEATTSCCIVPFRRGEGVVMKDYPEGYIRFIKGSEGSQIRWIRKYHPEILILHYQEEDDLIIPIAHRGILLSRQDVLELIQELQKFYETVTDEEIEEYNNRPVEPSPIPAQSPPKAYKPIPGWVYLVKAEGINKYKIGLSAKPKIRLKQLRGQSPIALHLIHLIKCNDSVVSEQKLHKRFEKFRVEGEWFELDEDAVDYIKSLETL